MRPAWRANWSDFVSAPVARIEQSLQPVRLDMPPQRAVLKPLLPKGTKAGRPPVWPRRQLIDGIRFRVRTGVPWRDVPVEYGPWGRVYDLFRRWQRNGTWHRILSCLQALADTKGAITWDLNVDSAVCRAHQYAAGARKQGGLK